MQLLNQLLAIRTHHSAGGKSVTYPILDDSLDTSARYGIMLILFGEQLGFKSINQQQRIA